MDSRADLAIVEWIETLPSNPITSLTMDESDSAIQTRLKGKGKRPAEPEFPSSMKTRKTESRQVHREPSTAITIPPQASASVTFDADQETTPRRTSWGQFTPQRRPSASAQSSRASSPDRSVKQREQMSDWYWLTMSIPKAIFVDCISEEASSTAPTRQAVERLVDILVKAANKRQYQGSATDITTILQQANRARQCHWVESKWYSVVQSIFQVAIGDRGLEANSMIYDALDKRYLPVWVNQDGKNMGSHLDRKIDFAIVFPRDRCGALYQATSQSFGYNNNPFKRDASCHEFVGIGLEVKDHNGSPADAEGQIGIWCVAYFQWLRTKRTTDTPLPPMVACTMVGVAFNFFIAYAIEEPELKSLNVIIWGPHLKLRGLLDTKEGITRVLNTLQALFDYIEGDFIEQLQRLRP